MDTADVERLRQIKTLPSLVKFLRDELDWPVEADEIDELTFDYTSEELGLDSKYAKMIREIKQLRPLDSQQPWGIFWVNFEKKRLPMVVLRRILGSLVIKRLASARKTDRPSWHPNDLLFISSYGEEEHRTISFAHFAEEPDTDQLPVLRVLGWDDRKSIMNLDRVGNRLHSHLRWPADSKAADAWRKRWSEAFTDRYREAIRSADELIPRLAELAAGVRARVRDMLHAEIERGPMRRLFAAVQKLLIHDMNEDGFADMYAQTVAYGLLSARFSRPEGLTAQNLVQLTAVSNPFLENLLENLFRLNRGKFHFDVDEVGINDVLDLLRNTNIEAIKAAFSDKNPAEDPVIRFYEGFLKQYDPQQRIQRGVFFTPRPVVSYIVRSVDELLQTEFGLEDGLASTATWAEMKEHFPELTIPKGAKPNDAFVCILDPAVGTGTFLFECIEVIERTMKDKWRRQLGKQGWSDPEIIKRWREYVRKHLLPRLYGYELMMAPYAIAHLKLALKLGETGYQFQEKDRLHIYLTNSLEPPSKLADLQLADLFTALATEAQEVNEVKRNKCFTVVIGNPPYARISSNMRTWISALIEDFKYVDGVHFGEVKHWLHDDYVKFLRFSFLVLKSSGCGILGMITNRGYLSGPTFRGMRCFIWQNSSTLHLLDLHGGAIQEECKPPPGVNDKNVFEIKQGVAIFVSSLTLKTASKSARTYAELWGDRNTKYSQLAKQSACSQVALQLAAVSPRYDFIPGSSADLDQEYSDFIAVNEIFPVGSTGIQTSRDGYVVDFERNKLMERFEEFCDSKLPDAFFRTRYGLKDGRNWSLADARRKLRADQKWHERIVRCQFRPLDTRWMLYHASVINWPRPEVMPHMLRQNVALIAPRNYQGGQFDAALVSRYITEVKTGESTRGSYCYPLYLYGPDGLHRPKRNDAIPNIKESVTTRLSRSLKLKFIPKGFGDLKSNFGPEGVLSYIYAGLYSEAYRKRYSNLLKNDFPRLPLTSNLELFVSLAKLGGELVSLHLMESDKLDARVASFPIPGSNTVAKVGESKRKLKDVTSAKGKLYINNTQYFDNVPEEVWNFHIGGYQVCHKWLADRKKAGRKLSTEDIEHYHKIVVSINETIKIMKQIDETIAAHGGWPKAFINKSIGKDSKNGS